MKTSKTFILATTFSFACASVWIVAVRSAFAQTASGYTTAIAPVSQPKATTQSTSAGGQIGPGTSSPQVGNNSSRDPKSNVKINAVKKN